MNINAAELSTYRALQGANDAGLGQITQIQTAQQDAGASINEATTPVGIKDEMLDRQIAQITGLDKNQDQGTTNLHKSSIDMASFVRGMMDQDVAKDAYWTALHAADAYEDAQRKLA